MPPTDPGNVPEEVFLTIATMADPIDPQTYATLPMFRMVVEAGFIHGRAAGLAAGRTAAAADALMAAREDLAGVAGRLRAKARETGDKTHVGTAAGVDLACFRLVELAERAARVAENEADR